MQCVATVQEVIKVHQHLHLHWHLCLYLNWDLHKHLNLHLQLQLHLQVISRKVNRARVWARLNLFCPGWPTTSPNCCLLNTIDEHNQRQLLEGITSIQMLNAMA